MKLRIIADSCCDLRTADYKSDKFDFITVPISMAIGEESFLDEESLDIKELISVMKSNKSPIKSACPSPETFAEEMRKGGNVICITLSSKISGTYNSARLAAEMVLKEYPDKKIFVLDSLLASSGMTLVLNQLKVLIESGKYNSFEEIIEKLVEFKSSVNIKFVLQDLGNLIKTGRMSKITGLIASVLTIRPICGDDGSGEIKMFSKALGTKKALIALSNYPAEKVEKLGNGIPVVITHCNNEEDAVYLKSLLEAKFGLTNIKIYLMRGISSFYANDRGISIAY